jgi:ATP cone domain
LAQSKFSRDPKGEREAGNEIMEDNPPAPPAWVHKRDGRQEPFDADKISRALFAASESLKRPDAFLARELTDGVVYFLTEETDGATPTTIQIAELVGKVVRELGQPALAATFAEYGARRDRDKPSPADLAASEEVVLRFAAGAPLEKVLAACVHSYTLQTVFARDLAAAQGDGLLTLTGLEAPYELLGCVLGPPIASVAEDGVLAAVEKARGFAGGLVAVDGPEYLLSHSVKAVKDEVREFARELALGLRLTGMRAVVNLNCAAPPSWAGDLAEGPLFAGQIVSPAPEQLASLADGLARELLRQTTLGDQVRIDWHLSERDFAPEAGQRLTTMAQFALEGAAVRFAFDRPRRPVSLAEGMDRQHPAVLLMVGVHLPRLAEQPGVDGDATRFLKKLGSLARLALSAAVQKREFLRRQDSFKSGFILDRARLVVAPVGLDAVVTAFTGGGLCSSKESLDFGKQIVQTLRDVLRQDGGACRLGTCLDGPDDFRLGDGKPTIGQVAGLTAWDATAPPKQQLRVAGALHSLAEGGTAALILPEDPRPTAEAVADYLRSAWKQTDVNRVRLLRGVQDL